MPLIERLVRCPNIQGDRERLREVCHLTLLYIADTVRHMLTRKPTGFAHLGAILEICRRASGVGLATLNHDLVLEEALREAEIGYSDGFEQSDEDVRLWVDAWNAPVRLLKLHGSLDWWGYKLANAPWRGWVTTRFHGVDPWNPARPGVLRDPYDFRPLILTGTYDKILAYETWIFPDQHLRFHGSLRQTKRVIVIGYSFGDKAINSRLIGWLARARDHKLIVCHPSPDELFVQARSAIQSKRETWEEGSQLTVVTAPVATLGYNTIAEHLPI
jgi:SIR2-like domain